MNALYLGGWADSGLRGIIEDFDFNESHEDFTKSREILLACYNNAGYEADAFVLYREGGLLFEVNGSHCSCYGLEGQWEPEETSVNALLHRLDKGSLGAEHDGGNIFAQELRDLLKGMHQE